MFFQFVQGGKKKEENSNYENVSCFCCFSWKKKRKNVGEKLLDKNGPNKDEFPASFWRASC